MAILSDLPPEILEQVLLELDPLDVGAVSQTCVLFHELIYGSSSELFWQKLYLTMMLDDPRQCVDSLGHPVQPEKIRWRESLQRIIRAREIVKHPEHVYSKEDRLAACRTLLDLTSNTPPQYHGAVEDDISSNLLWVASLLRDGTFLKSFTAADSNEERQLGARLHTLYGLIAEDFDRENVIDSLCTVYTLRNFTHWNEYGPFLKDRSGRVDWEIVRAIQQVISLHLVPKPPSTNVYVPSPLGLPFCSTVLDQTGVSLDEVDDWAGVEGGWQCAFSFCDHRELLVFNNLAAGGPYRREIFEDPDFREAFTLIEFSLHITDTEYDEAHPTRPIIHFAGTSRGSGAEIEGSVRVNVDGDVRWQFVSNRTWSSEGVQLGSVRSDYGVLGIWTTAQHDRIDPVGPFWLHKKRYDDAEGLSTNVMTPIVVS